MAAAEAATVVVPMPHMGVSVEEGTVIEWLVAAGDEVEADQVLCAIATDKVDTEVVAPSAGTVVRIIAPEGADVPVGEPLAELSAAAGGGVRGTAEAGAGAGPGPGDATPRGEPEAGAAEAGGASRGVSAGSVPAPARASSAGGVAPGLAERVAAGRDEFGRFDPKRAAAALLSFVPPASSTNGSGALASPIARRMASGHGVDLASIEGSGRGGRIRKRDVELAVSSQRGVALPGNTAEKATPGGAVGLPPGYAGVPHEVVETPRVRRVIAEHMARSRQTAAHMTTEVDVDLTALTAVRGELNAARLGAGEPKLSYLPFLARAACDALADHRELNATFRGETTILWEQVNLGVAVDTEEGLLVPVVKGCERLDVAAIGAAIADLAERARTRKLTPDDLAGGTFTLSNPGSVGAVSAPAIINQPQVAVLGVPAIQRRPWAVSDDDGAETVAIRPILRLAVTFDHRALDGADATRFAVAVKSRLESWGAGAYAEAGTRFGA